MGHPHHGPPAGALCCKRDQRERKKTWTRSSTPFASERGSTGWGGPLIIQPNNQRDKIVAVTGGGIPPVARKLAEMTGATAVDGFRAPPVEGEIAAVVVDCGGTARCGVYPRKRIPTINLTPVGQSGPARSVHHRGHLRLRREDRAI